MAVNDPLRKLLDELKELHLRAGKPSCRDIKLGIDQKIGPGRISHNTVNKMFTKLTKRAFLELVVQHLGGDIEHFVELWAEASRAAGSRPRQSPPNAGHLQEGEDLLDRGRAERLVEQAAAEAEEIIKRAQSEAGEIVRKARVQAARLQAEAAEKQRQSSTLPEPVSSSVTPTAVPQQQRHPTAPLIPVTAPRLGESVDEMTVARWIKRVGEWVVIDEPMLEVVTDKVDIEIPAPASGILFAIYVEEDETVPVGTELASLVVPPAALTEDKVSPAAEIPHQRSTSEQLKDDIQDGSYKSPEPWYEAG
jgi:biotin carboxyl carrier protein